MKRFITNIVAKYVDNCFYHWEIGNKKYEEAIYDLNEVKDNIDKIVDCELYGYIETKIMYINQIEKEC